MNCRPFFFIFLANFLIVAIALAESADSSSVKENDSNNTAISEKKPAYGVSFLPDELSWRNGFGQAVAVSGIIIGTLVVLGVFAWLLAPVFGYRLCTVLGNCETPVVLAHANGGNLQDPVQANGYSDLYNSVVSPYMAAYRKRSLKYVGPLLKTLASAYEKFDQQQPVSAAPTKSD